MPIGVTPDNLRDLYQVLLIEPDEVGTPRDMYGRGSVVSGGIMEII